MKLNFTQKKAHCIIPYIPKIKRYNLLFLLILLSCTVSAYGQKGKALLTDFRFIVNDTQEFPNYFRETDLKEAVYNRCLKLLRDKIGFQDIEAYQAEEIEYSFSPPYRNNIDFIEKDNGYDYFIAVTSSAGINTSSDGEKTYLIYLKVQIKDKGGKVLFSNKSNAQFHLKYSKSILYDEAVISESDFKSLYISLLDHTILTNQPQPVKVFTKPVISVYNGFLSRADTFSVQQNNTWARRKFMTQKGEKRSIAFFYTAGQTSDLGSMRFGKVLDVLKYSKPFRYKNKLTRQKYQITGYYEENIDYKNKRKYIKSTRLQVKARRKTTFLNFYPEERSSWLYTLEGQLTDTTTYTLTANRYTNYIEAFAEGALVAIIQLPNSVAKLNSTKDKNFTFYFKKDLEHRQRADITDMFAMYLMTNSFMEDVSDFEYEAVELEEEPIRQ